MFATLLGLGRAKEKHEYAAEELQRLLEEKASLVVDDRLIAELGVGRKALYRIVYDMIRRERMFMLADGDDRMLLMTNTEFRRLLFRRAGREMPEAEERAAAFAAAARRAAAPDSDICLENEDSDIVLEENWEIPAAALDSAIAGRLSPAIPPPLPAGAGAWSAPGRRAPALPPKTGRDDLGWFRLDVAPMEAEEAERDGMEMDLPEYRQSLPERRREAWAV